jgi:hypothetical protein
MKFMKKILKKILKKNNRKYLITSAIILSICIYFLYTKKENMSNSDRRKLKKRKELKKKREEAKIEAERIREEEEAERIRKEEEELQKKYKLCPSIEKSKNYHKKYHDGRVPKQVQSSWNRYGCQEWVLRGRS